MVEFIKMVYKEQNRTGESKQNSTEIAESRSFVYLVMFIKPVFRQTNIA